MEKEKSRAVDVLDNRRTEHTPRKCFRFGSEKHMIAKFPKPPKDNKKRRKQVRFMRKVTVNAKTAKNNSDQKIYASMARMSGNDECPSGSFGDSSQLTN